MIAGKEVEIYGDGSTTRDFCHVGNVIQASILSSTLKMETGGHEVFNVAAGGRTSLNSLFGVIRNALLPRQPHLVSYQPVYKSFRKGDICHSQASVEKAQRVLGYSPACSVEEALAKTVTWYSSFAKALGSR